jgi:hypothetical protein
MSRRVPSRGFGLLLVPDLGGRTFGPPAADTIRIKMSRATRIAISITAAVFVVVGLVVFVFPSGCNDMGGVPSWERCITPVGTPAFSVEDWGWPATLNVIPPLAAGVLVGVLVWLVLGRSDSNGR